MIGRTNAFSSRAPEYPRTFAGYKIPPGTQLPLPPSLRANDSFSRRECTNEDEKSREQLLGIIEQWTLACRVEEFFVDLDTQSESIPETEREVVRERIQQAREMFGGVDTLKRFGAWKTPEQREAKEHQWPWSFS